jgi:O-antigen/teichoic acid export membrane protein
MELNTLIEVLFRVTLVGLGLCAIFLDWGGRIIFAFSLVGGMASLTCALVLFRKVVGPLRVRVDWGLCRYLVTEGFPFLLTGAFITIYHRIDTVMLFWMKGETAAGWYGAAHGLTDALLLVPVAAHGAVYPVLSRLYGQTKQGLQTAFGLVFNSLLLLVLPIGTGTTVLAGTIVQAAFPPEFRHSTIAVQLLIWTVVLVYLNAPMSALLCSAHRQRRLAVIVFWMAVLNIVLNLALIPRWGHAGAALATVVTELFGFIWIVRTISGSIVSIHWIPRLLKSALATAAMTGVVLALGGLSVYFRIASGAAVYLAVLFALRPFDHGEIQIAKSLLAARGRALAG